LDIKKQDMELKYSVHRSDLRTDKRIYKCNTCKELFNWNEHSSWLGSLKQMEEEPESIIYICSDTCKKDDIERRTIKL